MKAFGNSPFRTHRHRIRMTSSNALDLLLLLITRPEKRRIRENTKKRRRLREAAAEEAEEEAEEEEGGLWSTTLVGFRTEAAK